MKVIGEIVNARKEVLRSRYQGSTIGFVPTMGNLHDGHLSLLKRSKEENDFSVLSIYVNPPQFGKNEDFGKYPRTLEEDLEKAKACGTDLVFVPADGEIYPEGFSTYVCEERISLSMEGKKRPGHFRGVLTVVAKLFNIVTPDSAYFGQKDAQQAVLIRKMVGDLDMDIKIRVCPTIREKSGLAMSSRNNYLSASERERAAVIFKALSKAKDSFMDGETRAASLIGTVEEVLTEEPEMKADYIAVTDLDSLSPLNTVGGDGLISLSIAFKGVHLIDNIVLSKKGRLTV